MKLLFIDTCSASCGIAAAHDGKVSELIFQGDRTLSSRLLSLVQVVLNDARLELRELDAIGVVTGPGSFTGVRIGVATVHGLAAAAGLPVAGFSSLELLAMNVPFCPDPVCVMLDARKKEVYSALYSTVSGTPVRIAEERVGSPATVLDSLQTSAVCVGDGTITYGAHFRDRKGEPIRVAPPFCNIVRPAAGLHLLEHALVNGRMTPLEQLLPRYIRPSEAELAKQASLSL